MKVNRLVQTFALALVLSAGALGCKTNPYGVTKLPNGAGDKSDNTITDPLPGGRLTGENDTNNATGIAFGDRKHDGWPQDREILKADTVHFEYDKATIRKSEMSKVSAVADYLKANSANAVLIEGHCDERGTDEYNRSLGDRRAIALREELAKLGVSADRVDVISFGRDRPADTGHSDAAHARNRRGEFVVLTPPNK